MTRRHMLALVGYVVAGCGTEPSGYGPPSGVWLFEASWGGCTISAATLTLQHTGMKWTGTLTGGEGYCAEEIPGEGPTTYGPLDATLNSIRVSSDSISFEFEGGNASARGQLSAQGMNGTMDVVSPFCQCTVPTIHGDWSATRP